MKRALSTFIISFGLYLNNVNAQSSLHWLLENKDFQPILERHINEIKKKESNGWTPISALYIRTDTSGLVIYLTSLMLLSELEDNLPASYKFVINHPFLIYDGSEILISDTLSWFNELKSKIGFRLCDNLTYLEEYKKPNPKEIKIPCSFIYEPPIEKFIFRKGRLIEKKVVVEVPY